jgi:hypothetical protein
MGVDMVGVTGSIPVAPTTTFNDLAAIGGAHLTFVGSYVGSNGAKAHM